MKRLLIILLVLVGIGCAFAQNIKIAYVNTDRIIAGSNEANEIARVYQLDRQNWMNQIKDMNDAIKQMERNYEIDKLTKNEAAKREAQAKIDAKKTQAGQMLEEYFGDGGKAEQRYKELIEPLTKKIADVIKKMAQDEKYTVVLDVSMGTVMYADPSLDITDAVLAELNKENEKANADKPGNIEKPQDNTQKPGDTSKPGGNNPSTGNNSNQKPGGVPNGPKK